MGRSTGRRDDLKLPESAIDDLDNPTPGDDISPIVEELTGRDAEPAFDQKLQNYLYTYNI
jgi:hypothetical protein